MERVKLVEVGKEVVFLDFSGCTKKDGGGDGKRDKKDAYYPIDNSILDLKDQLKIGYQF
jgi:hypothetical protein